MSKIKHKKPILTDELISLYGRNEVIISELTRVKNDVKAFFVAKPNEHRKVVKDGKKVADEILRMHFESNFLSTDLRIVAKSKKAYSDTPDLNTWDIAYARAFLNKSASNCRKCSKILLRLYILLSNYEKNQNFNLVKKINASFKIVSLYLNQNRSCILFLIQDNKIKYLTAEITSNPEKYKIPKSGLRKGDVILSYKPNKFLKKHLITFLIWIAEGSRFTHSYVVAYHKKDIAKCLIASGYGKSVGVAGLKQEDGEILFAFRPKIDAKTKKLLYKSINKWSRLLTENDIYSFSNSDLIFALLEGILYRLVGYITKRTIFIPNPFEQKTRFYCSELVNRIFYDAGILLTPRSIHGYLVGPFEFSYSYCLNFIGIVEPENSAAEVKQN